MCQSIKVLLWGMIIFNVLLAQKNIDKKNRICSHYNTSYNSHNFDRLSEFKRSDYNYCQNMTFFQNSAWSSEFLYTEIITQNLDTTNGQWQDYAKATITYDKNGNLINIITKKEKNGIWLNYTKLSYSYDERFNITERLLQTNNGFWVNYSKRKYKYSDNDNVIEGSFFSWDQTANQWVSVDDEKYIYTFNDKGFLIEIWYPDEYEEGYKEIYTYSKNNSTIEMFEYDFITNEWIKDSLYRTIYIFNENNNLIESRSQNWDPDSNQWINNTFHNVFLDYEANENLKEVESKRWVIDTFFTTEYRASYYYTPDINIIDVNWYRNNLDGLLRNERYSYLPRNEVISIKNISSLTSNYNLTIRRNSKNIEIIIRDKNIKRPLISVYDIKGRLINNILPVESKEKLSFYWDFNKLSNNVFLLVLRNSDKVLAVKKIINPILD